MSFSTLTRYLRLRIQTDLSQPASQNLARLDALGNTFAVGQTDDLEVRSRGNIILKPEATPVGGAGSGGEVHIGSSAQPVAVKFFATSFQVEGGAGSLLTEDSLNTVTNKSISGSTNLLSNIGYSSLLLSNSIKNSDIASDAGIADTKLATIATPGKVNVSALTGSLSGSLLPSFDSNDGKYLKLVDGALSWETAAGGGGVTSFNGQTGDVTAYFWTEEGIGNIAETRIGMLKGLPGGYAGLDESGKVPVSMLPDSAAGQVHKQNWTSGSSITINHSLDSIDAIVHAWDLTTNEPVFFDTVARNAYQIVLSVPSGVTPNYRVVIMKA